MQTKQFVLVGLLVQTMLFIFYYQPTYGQINWPSQLTWPLSSYSYTFPSQSNQFYEAKPAFYGSGFGGYPLQYYRNPMAYSNYYNPPVNGYYHYCTTKNCGGKKRRWKTVKIKTTKEIITPNNFFVLIRKEKHFRCIFSVRKNEHFECIYLCSKWPINIHCFYFHCNFFNQIFLTKSRDDIRFRLHRTVFDRQEL